MSSLQSDVAGWLRWGSSILEPVCLGLFSSGLLSGRQAPGGQCSGSVGGKEAGMPQVQDMPISVPSSQQPHPPQRLGPLQRPLVHSLRIVDLSLKAGLQRDLGAPTASATDSEPLPGLSASPPSPRYLEVATPEPSGDAEINLRLLLPSPTASLGLRLLRSAKLTKRLSEFWFPKIGT